MAPVSGGCVMGIMLTVEHGDNAASCPKSITHVSLCNGFCWQQVVVMEFGKRHDTTDTTVNLLQTCRRLVVYVADLLRGKWCNGFWPLTRVMYELDLHLYELFLHVRVLFYSNPCELYKIQNACSWDDMEGDMGAVMTE